MRLYYMFLACIGSRRQRRYQGITHDDDDDDDDADDDDDDDDGDDDDSNETLSIPKGCVNFLDIFELTFRMPTVSR